MAPREQLCLEPGCYATTTRSRCDRCQRAYLKRRRNPARIVENKLLLDVIARDDFCCVRCGNDRLELLAVHHLNGDVHDNRLENLITVCGICDLEAHRFLRLRRQQQKEQLIREQLGAF